MNFTLIFNDKNSDARCGILETDRGKILTPVFMPVGTAGTVKGIHQRELDEEVKAQIILGNTYHLFLRPGMEIISGAGGLHKFIGWNKPMLTDSGGYQVYSLSEKRKISEEGVSFTSHIDGTNYFLSPESVIDIERTIGADIIMVLDECSPYPCEKNYAKNAMELTHRWLIRSIKRFSETIELYDNKQFLFPIVQGSVYNDLRSESAKYISDLDCDGNAIGGLSVGEPHDEMYSMAETVCSILPKHKPRYLMGVGTPENLLECIALGIDMFDCVIPTRNGRNGTLYTSNGIINIRNEKWKNDFSELDADGTSFVDHAYSKAYLRHLTVSKEMLAAQISTIH
ncbi:MAG: tRNA guanosine(34) transglycosylase Tgt, partial [Bacteroidia bacterium]|nr:tRNA guanosine(34) transglycosylase Tgt [Bacteroidia bacterium]